MTFTEAAEAVLRKSGKPLHYKKITQLAIEQNLLSHIGKTPEVTMSTRLATLTKKDRGDQNILRVGPGVFGLREWGAAPVEVEGEEAAEAAEVAAPEAHAEAGEEIAAGEAIEPAPGPAPLPSDEEPVVLTPEEEDRKQRIDAASEIFPEDEDDNELVLGGPEKAEGGRRRRRRRRPRRDGAAPGAEGEAAPVEGAVAEGEAAQVEGEAAVAPAGEAAAEGVEPVVRAEPRREERREERRGDDRREERRGDDRRDERREPRDRRDERRGDDRRDERRDERRDDRQVEEGATGRDTADMLVAMLSRREDRQPVGLRGLAEEAVRSGRLSGDPVNLIPTLAAAARMDGARREARGERARLRLAGGRLGLMDWTLPPELLRAEADAVAALERLRDAARRYVVRRLNELPQAAFTEAVVLLLERLGISSLRVTRRAGLPQGEVHLMGVARRGPEETPVAVVIRRGGEVGRERVIDLRGALHHYGNAVAAWIITTGSVLSGARDEAAVSGVAPVTLVDGVAFGRLLDEHSVCTSHVSVALPYLDVELFDALRNV